MSSSPPITLSPEVAAALHDGTPVVALETNVITHGLEYPRNAEAATKVQAAVRLGGAVPATIGIDAGRILIGLDKDQIERFATSPSIPKVSSRDMGHAVAAGGMGATTVASSVVAAHAAGIKHFCSAGIGGVHHGVQNTLDISSDLIQFARTPLMVVCAGAKNILNLPLTLEFLETQCVPVVSYRSDDFPAFYCRSSGLRSPRRIDDPVLLAEMAEQHWSLGSSTAVVVTTPPREEDSIDFNEAQSAVEDALREASRTGITGKDVTKFLMRCVDRATDGRSSTANMAVLVSTAEVAGQLATVHAMHVAESASTHDPHREITHA
ncbi:pseudouridine-5'-phosphate glycosidase [Aeromicrobium sp.]|uniref:pseudouridine-5'-phosphate glycosidase n=1 Tax=Aeromicrobium sp. TaxID=1871063 RepID=UPI0019A88450|nr:pseudouridine-5'-phosphate glycosidase [Aeromicrobium sp.]MBC7631522.1 pseudouridine-5'-phosphate glycosidase [Aeromicrobium sp.]